MGVLSKAVSKGARKAASKKGSVAATKEALERVKNTNPSGQGKRFSDRENTQKGSTDSRKVTAKGTTNKNDKTPAFTGASVVKDQIEDIRVMLKPRNVSDKAPPALQKQAESARKAAKGRAASRTAVRGAAVTASPLAGYAAADYAREKMKNPEANPVAKTASKKPADERKNKSDYPTYKKGTESAAGFREAFKKAKDAGNKTFTFEGRKYNTADKK